MGWKLIALLRVNLVQIFNGKYQRNLSSQHNFLLTPLRRSNLIPELPLADPFTDSRTCNLNGTRSSYFLNEIEISRNSHIITYDTTLFDLRYHHAWLRFSLYSIQSILHISIAYQIITYQFVETLKATQKENTDRQKVRLRPDVSFQRCTSSKVI